MLTSGYFDRSQEKNRDLNVLRMDMLICIPDFNQNVWISSVGGTMRLLPVLAERRPLLPPPFRYDLVDFRGDV